MNYLQAVRALQKGVALSNVKAWRTTGTALAATSAFLTALVSFAISQGWLTDQVDPQLIMSVSSLIVTLVFTVLGYLGVATDEEQGIKPKDNHFLGD